MATNFFSPTTPVGASLSNLAASLFAEESPAKQAEREAAIEQKRSDAALKKARIADYHAKEQAASDERALRATAPLRIASGVMGGDPQGAAVMDYRKAGGIAPPLVPNDDEGYPLPSAPMPRPEGYTPQKEDALNRILTGIAASSTLPGKTNYEQLMKGSGEAQSQDIIGQALAGILTPQQQSDVAGARSKPVYKEGAAGDKMNLFTGAQDQTAPLPVARVGEIKAKAGSETALGGQRNAAGAKLRAETLPQVQVPVPGGGTVSALGKDAGKAALTAANAPAGGDMTPEAIEHAAQRYAIDRTLPPNMGRGAQGAAKTSRILNRAAEIAAASGDSSSAAAISQINNKASAMALGQLAKQEQMVGAFEKNAIYNADIALANSKAVDRTGIPILNKWILAGGKDILGDVDIHKFHQSVNTFANEYAKIMSGSMGNTPVSDSMRHEQMGVLATKDTPEQFEATVNQMKQEMQNRIKGFAAQKDELTRSMTPRGGAARPTTAPTAAAPAGPEPTATDAAGNKMVYRGGQWVPLR